MAYVAWMASFTETVEKHNPAATATGLAIWGWILRLVVTVSLAVLHRRRPGDVGILVDKGTEVADAGRQVPEPSWPPCSQGRPGHAEGARANPNDPAAGAKAVSEVAGVPVTDVVKASAQSQQYAHQLQTAAAVDPATLAALRPTRATPAAQPRRSARS